MTRNALIRVEGSRSTTFTWDGFDCIRETTGMSRPTAFRKASY